MTPLAADNNAVITKGGKTEYEKSYLVADNVLIYKGAICVIDASGYLRPARNTAGEIVAGVAFEHVDNTISGHVAGGLTCRVIANAEFDLLCSATATQASVGQPFYALDDQTVRATTGVGNLAGIVTTYIDATHVSIYIPMPILPLAADDGVAGVASGYKIARGVHTQVAASDTIVSGLATVVAVVVSPKLYTVNQQWFGSDIGNQAGAPAAGSFLVTSWKATDHTNDTTPTAATTFTDNIPVNWIAIGT